MNANARFDTARRLAPFRPIQYLGNKLRVLGPITDMVSEMIGGSGRVADLFTGSSVVAQALCSEGHSVSAIDTQDYSVAIAKAMLGVDRMNAEELAPNLVLAEQYTPRRLDLWSELSYIEERKVAEGDYEGLLNLYRSLPLKWKDLSDVDEGPDEALLITELYSGSYFGISQAIAIDRLRVSAGSMYRSGRLSSWQYYAALTAIMSASSSAVNSAGKHFAQPLLAGSSRNIDFLKKRVLSDRRISIYESFFSSCNEINSRGLQPLKPSFAYKDAAEDFVQAHTNFDLFYLDPPYTAQQYSRFYHLLETIATYEVPELAHNGRVTTGLYPAKRYKSAFSSRTKAIPAFKTILSSAKKNGTSVLISYSSSTDSSTGNARMVSLTELLDACQLEFGKHAVQCVEMKHKYRQFNSAAKANELRDDPEILIACKTS